MECHCAGVLGMALHKDYTTASDRGAAARTDRTALESRSAEALEVRSSARTANDGDV